jgi:hypothetical protein
MVDKPDIFSGAMADWEPVEQPRRGLDSLGRVSAEADHVAKEFTIVSRKYGKDSAASMATTRSSDSSEHATLVRAKKKGSMDNDVNAKTFVVSGDKIVGSQG